MDYGYCRVSTLGQSLANQKSLLRKAGIENKHIFYEKVSGMTVKDRPELTKLMQILKPGDTVTVTKLDRLARNTKEALAIIDDLLERDIAINVLNLGKLENTSVGKLIYTILLAVAEMERDMIVTRMQEGKSYAKQHNPNYKEGRPNRKLTPRYMHALELLKSHTLKETAEMTGISTATLTRIKRQYKEEQEA